MTNRAPEVSIVGLDQILTSERRDLRPWGDQSHGAPTWQVWQREDPEVYEAAMRQKLSGDLALVSSGGGEYNGKYSRYSVYSRMPEWLAARSGATKFIRPTSTKGTAMTRADAIRRGWLDERGQP